MLFKRVLTHITFLLFLSVAIGCGSTRQIYNQSDWQTRKDNVRGDATILVANVDFDAKIKNVSGDNLIIEQNGYKSELPVNVISKITFSGDANKKKKIIWGGVIGGVIGIGAGYAAGSAISNESGPGAAAHPISMALILGGIVGGAFAGSSFTKYEEYSLGNTLAPFIMHPDVGAEITPAEIRGYSLFEDLQTDPDDKILQVQIFKLPDATYFLLYDVSYLGSYSVRWKTTDENYLMTQKAKIKTQD